MWWMILPLALLPEGQTVIDLHLWQVVIVAAPVGYVMLLLLARWIDRKVRSR